MDFQGARTNSCGALHNWTIGSISVCDSIDVVYNHVCARSGPIGCLVFHPFVRPPAIAHCSEAKTVDFLLGSICLRFSPPHLLYPPPRCSIGDLSLSLLITLFHTMNKETIAHGGINTGSPLREKHTTTTTTKRQQIECA